jgi:GT2 family glycosyltransferase
MTTTNRVDLSIIIVSFNTVEILRDCLLSIYTSDNNEFTFEVLVCDNASSDGSLDMVKRDFPLAKLIQNSQNLGFAAANNIAIKKSKGKYILLLNSDTVVGKMSLQNMITFISMHPKCGVATCKLILPNGLIDPACHRGFPTPWAALCYAFKLERLFPKSALFSGYHLLYKDFTIPHEIDCPSGAFFLVRREVIDQVGLLDEDYFMYAEDIDWAYRIKKSGWQIWFNPESTILHKKKQSGRLSTDRSRRVKTQILFEINNRLFFTKHYAKKYGLIISSFVYLYYWFRLLLLTKLAF